MITVASLRKSGWKVRVIHRREYTVIGWFTSPRKMLNARGGSTIVEITPPGSDTVYKGETKVHPKDNYNRKVGVSLCLERALAVAGIPVSE